MGKARQPRVSLFTAGRCAYCERARALLRARRISFEELKIDRSSRASTRYQRLGARGVPVLLIGNQRIDGFQPDLILRALRQGGLLP